MLIARSWYADVNKNHFVSTNTFRKNRGKAEIEMRCCTVCCWFPSVFWHKVQLLAFAVRMRVCSCLCVCLCMCHRGNVSRETNRALTWTTFFLAPLTYMVYDEYVIHNISVPLVPRDGFDSIWDVQYCTVCLIIRHLWLTRVVFSESLIAWCSCDDAEWLIHCLSFTSWCSVGVIVIWFAQMSDLNACFLARDSICHIYAVQSEMSRPVPPKSSCMTL